MTRIVYLAIAYLSMSSAIGETLSVAVTGVEPGKGAIRLALFDESSRDSFPNGEYTVGIDVPASAERTVLEIPDLVAGNYAISVYQDANNNQELDKNIFGIPKEPYGFSGRWTSGGAKYEEAVFDAESEGYSITIKLK